MIHAYVQQSGHSAENTDSDAMMMTTRPDSPRPASAAHFKGFAEGYTFPYHTFTHNHSQQGESYPHIDDHHHHTPSNAHELATIHEDLSPVASFPLSFKGAQAFRSGSPTLQRRQASKRSSLKRQRKIKVPLGALFESAVESNCVSG